MSFQKKEGLAQPHTLTFLFLLKAHIPPNPATPARSLHKEKCFLCLWCPSDAFRRGGGKAHGERWEASQNSTVSRHKPPRLDQQKLGSRPTFRSRPRLVPTAFPEEYGERACSWWYWANGLRCCFQVSVILWPPMNYFKNVDSDTTAKRPTRQTELLPGNICDGKAEGCFWIILHWDTT